MGEPVAGFGVPHSRCSRRWSPARGRSARRPSSTAVAEHLRTIKPDALGVLDSDHLNTFFRNNYQNLSVGVTDQTVGPNDGTPVRSWRSCDETSHP
jgi:hypothetical protein